MKNSLAVALTCAVAAWASCAAVAGDQDRYSALILGDLHFDAAPESVYHSDYDESCRWAADEHRQFARNGEMWKERMPRLLKAAAEAVSPDADFCVQLGDMIQGDCYNPATHDRMLYDAIVRIKSTVSREKPFLSVIGNHDYRGGGLQSYYPFMARFHSREIGIPVYSGDFVFRHGKDAYVFVDFNRVHFGRIMKMLEAVSEARWVFLVSHGPVVMSGSACTWFLLGEEKNTQQREKLFDRLLELHAIVLCGHNHILECMKLRSGKGCLAQYMVNSVFDAEESAELKELACGPDHYPFRGATTAYLRKLADAYRPLMTEYEAYESAGFSRLRVSDSSVEADYYGGDSRTPGRSFVLMRKTEVK